MQRYKADEWHSYKSAATIEVSLKEFVDIMVSCTEAVQIRAKGENCGAILSAGTGTFRFKGTLFGFSAVEISTRKNVEFGMRANLRSAQIGEPLDDQKAPVVPVPTSSDKLIADIQNAIRTEIRQNRETVLEPETEVPSLYGYQHENEDVFEEHETAAAEQAAKAAAEKAAATKADKKDPPNDPDPDPTPPDPDPDPSAS